MTLCVSCILTQNSRSSVKGEKSIKFFHKSLIWKWCANRDFKGPTLEKTDAGRDWGQEEKGMTEDEMAGWHHRLDGRESEWTPGVGDGQGGLACCDSWGRTRLSNWTELNWCWSKEASLCWWAKSDYKLQIWLSSSILIAGGPNLFINFKNIW